MEADFDAAETAILWMLELGALVSTAEAWRSVAKSRAFTHEIADVGGVVLKDQVMSPSDAYTVDLSLAGRLYAHDPALLVRPIWETINDSAEVFTLPREGEPAKWFGLRRLRSAPKGATYLGRAHAIYAAHFRVFGNRPVYGKDVIAFGGHGRALPLRFFGQASVQTTTATSAVAAASIIEDAHRSDAFLATVRDACTLRFPVGAGAHKDFFSLRDAPLTLAGKRKAIVHWVRAHRRANAETVAAHLRGVREIDMGGISVKLEANIGDRA